MSGKTEEILDKVVDEVFEERVHVDSDVSPVQAESPAILSPPNMSLVRNN